MVFSWLQRSSGLNGQSYRHGYSGKTWGQLAFSRFTDKFIVDWLAFEV